MSDHRPFVQWTETLTVSPAPSPSHTWSLTTVVIFPPFINEKNIMYAVHTVNSVHCDMIWSAYYAYYALHTMHPHSFTQCTVTQSMLRHQEPQQKSLWLIWAHSYGEHKINRSLHISCHTLISPILGDNGHHINMQEPWIICKYSKQHQLMIHNRVPIV